MKIKKLTTEVRYELVLTTKEIGVIIAAMNEYIQKHASSAGRNDWIMMVQNMEQEVGSSPFDS